MLRGVISLDCDGAGRGEVLAAEASARGERTEGARAKPGAAALALGKSGSRAGKARRAREGDHRTRQEGAGRAGSGGHDNGRRLLGDGVYCAWARVGDSEGATSDTCSSDEPKFHDHLDFSRVCHATVQRRFTTSEN